MKSMQINESWTFVIRKYLNMCSDLI